MMDETIFKGMMYTLMKSKMIYGDDNIQVYCLIYTILLPNNGGLTYYRRTELWERKGVRWNIVRGLKPVSAASSLPAI